MGLNLSLGVNPLAHRTIELDIDAVGSLASFKFWYFSILIFFLSMANTGFLKLISYFY